MTDGAKLDIPPPATDAEMDAWVAEGRRAQGGLEVLWHAFHAQRSGLSEAGCPFGDQAPEARRRWLDVFRAGARGEDQRHRRKPAAADEAEPGNGGQWWMKY